MKNILTILAFSILVASCEFDINPFAPSEFDGTFDDCFNDYDMTIIPFVGKESKVVVDYNDANWNYQYTFSEGIFLSPDDSTFSLEFKLVCDPYFNDKFLICDSLLTESDMHEFSMGGSIAYNQILATVSSNMGTFRNIEGDYRMLVSESSQEQFIGIEFEGDYSAWCGSAGAWLDLEFRAINGDKIHVQVQSDL